MIWFKHFYNMKEIRFCTYIWGKQRIDMYLALVFFEFSRSYIQKLIERWLVTVNGVVVNKNLKIEHKDELVLREVLESATIDAENIPLDIIYEDENILVLNKDAGINTHPTPGIEGKKGTLVNAVLYHTRGNLPAINGQERPGIVHRLDKDTSWAIMIAKNDTMMKYLAKRIEERKVEKYYIAILAGILSEKEFRIESFIGRHPTDKTRMTTNNPINPKLALTGGEVLGYINDMYTVVRVKLETGRTHQIRVHMASIWFPIIGDSVYGDEEINKRVKKEYGLTRQALHAHELKLMLYSKKTQFIAPLKEDMKKIIWDIFAL